MAKLVEQTSWTIVSDRYMKPVDVDYKSTFVEHNHFVFRKSSIHILQMNEQPYHVNNTSI